MPPETHRIINNQWVDTSGLEKIYGLKALSYAQETLPIGTKVRIINDDQQSYGRNVGALFYGSNYESNYNYQMIAQGLALPSMVDQEVKTKVTNKASYYHYLSLPLASAYQQAQTNHLNIFSQDLKQIYQIHPQTIKYLNYYQSNQLPNIYQYQNLDFWKE